MSLSERDEELLGHTPEEINLTLQYRDEVFSQEASCGQDIPTTDSSLFAPSTVDGVTMLLSRYGFSDSPFVRVFDAVSCGKGDESDLANLSRSLRQVPTVAGFISGMAAAAISIPGMYDQFRRENQFTVWRTREMAKRQALDVVLFRASKLALSVAVKSWFLTSGFLYAPFLMSAYRGCSSFSDHPVCFASTLAVFCLPRGPVPMVVGGAVGLLFGGLYGSGYTFVARRYGYTYEELYQRRLEKARSPTASEAPPPSLPGATSKNSSKC